MIKTCFVISPFGHPFDEYYKEIFVPAILKMGLRPSRADDIYGVRSIMQDIWDSIKNASVILADLTTKNANVFYELGIAHSYRKPVILLSRTLDDVPFDLRHYRVIIYNTSGVNWAAELRSKIINTMKQLMEGTADPRDFFSIEIGTSFAQNLGILKFVETSADRISDYKTCLEKSEGNCFITGTPMIHLSEDSMDIILRKQASTHFRLLIMNPAWIKQHSYLLTFLPSDAAKRKFYLEIENSIEKFKSFQGKVPKKYRKNISLKSYSAIFPYIMTGYEKDDDGQIVVELTDYLPERTRPRLTITKIYDSDTLAKPFQQMRNKFECLWNNIGLTEKIDL